LLLLVCSALDIEYTKSADLLLLTYKQRSSHYLTVQINNRKPTLIWYSIKERTYAYNTRMCEHEIIIPIGIYCHFGFWTVESCEVSACSSQSVNKRYFMSFYRSCDRNKPTQIWETLPSSVDLRVQKYYKNLEYANFLDKKYEFIHTTTRFIADVRSLLM